MSHKNISRSAVFRSVLVAGLLVLTSPGYAATIDGDPCSGAVAVDLNGSLRGHGNQPGEPLIVELAVPSPGILSVDVAALDAAALDTLAPGTAAAAKLGFAGCAPEVGPELAVLERSATHLVLAAEDPGTYFFRLAAEDPRRPLGDFKLRTGFSPDAGGDFAKNGEDEGEIEVEPNPLVHGGLGSSRSLVSRLDEICRSGEVDDYGDSFPCATFLGSRRAVAGEVRNGWGDDQDVFAIVLGRSQGSELRTLEIVAVSNVGLMGALYDRSGQRLAATADDGGFRIVRTLAAGIYYVSVRARDGAEGLYELRVEASAG